MESKVEALEQQNQDLKGEVGQLTEQMAQIFQMLTKTNAVVTTLVNSNVAGCAHNGYAALATLEIQLMGCHRDGTPKTLPTRSKNSRTL
ncbi:hypothetical protein CR513_14272, partial [Mucuna pruriens]